MSREDKLIKALRCTKSQNGNCTSCKYAVWMQDDSQLLDYCNTIQLEADAADLIEEADCKTR